MPSLFGKVCRAIFYSLMVSSFFLITIFQNVKVLEMLDFPLPLIHSELDSQNKERTNLEGLLLEKTVKPNLELRGKLVLLNGGSI